LSVQAMLDNEWAQLTIQTPSSTCIPFFAYEGNSAQLITVGRAEIVPHLHISFFQKQNQPYDNRMMVVGAERH